jgi:hypothetical protein
MNGKILLFAALLMSAPVRAGNQDQVYLETTGVGVADPKLKNSTQRQATARDAAITQAQFKMLFLINELQPRSESPVAREGVLKGARVVKTTWTGKDGCIITLRMDKDRLQDDP